MGCGQLLLFSPGIIQLRKGFWIGLETEVLVSGSGGGGGRERGVEARRL